jgi:hypothetical protein
MSRFALVGGMMVLGAVLAVRGTAPTPAKAAPAKESSPLAALQTVHPEFPEVPADPQTKLDSILNALTEVFRKNHGIELQFEINLAAFRTDGVAVPGDTAVVQERGLPKMTNLTLERYLRAILNRVPAGSGATLIPRKDHIEITTNGWLRTQIWGKDHKGPFLPLVNARFDKTSLDEALKALAEQSEHNVILDPKAGEKGKTLITARLLNLPLDTAVTMLADMADLQAVMQDNAIYVTTRESALRWESRNRRESGDDSGPRVGPGVRGLIPSENGGM